MIIYFINKKLHHLRKEKKYLMINQMMIFENNWNIQINDKRIKLINNKKNMGTLYSRSIGVLKAKGKYLFPLDNDDMFFDDDVFNIVYNEAYNFNYDIVCFKTI